MDGAEVRVRLATAADLEILRSFEQGIVAAERPLDPTLRPDPLHYYDLESLLENPHVDLMVAEHDGRLVGSGYARVEASRPFVLPEYYAYLGLMYVDPAYRGQGINALILEHLKVLVRARGITELRLEVYAGNEPAIRAYEKAGFEKLLVWMRLEIEP
ncbi:GNAT family N-acetyltransferase [Flaviaesturariibacter flavus]|uniref:GNAT family N-acetyltransferase n=2 Tax=Flaviaesturariibacter flavus TaxID=2502780 RepID=A0A4R1BAP8_9BACT|nr:GNAT family N-acetyltransferase [Flaviaesturariibacter flavus]